MNYVDPFESVKKLPAGLMLIGRAGNTVENMKTIFLIKEENKYINKLSKFNPLLQTRMGYYTSNSVNALLLMFKFETDMLYDGWLNYYSNDGKNFFDDLCKQDELIFKFYNDKECKRTLAINNTIKEQIIDYTQKIKNTEEWSMTDFNIIKNYVYTKYPDGNSLWLSLS